MEINVKLIATSVLSLGLLGCARSYCERAYDHCHQQCTASLDCYSVNECEQKISGCSDDDEKKLDTGLSCLENASTCTTDTLNQCYPDPSQLSMSCIHSLNGTTATQNPATPATPDPTSRCNTFCAQGSCTGNCESQCDAELSGNSNGC